ncbi:hypothetical protein [Streptomyces flavofungini]|uniref:Acyl-ACP thioesterase n=1 Tax=Streptomyces flavofungini TaxID=68200 RepID=A0ABS0WZF4_9ACTN|nr:hypothetical protein [Streptomyces flavofungini]MBJ3806305.1 hypothetical protein [Streptomyces flavofungini]GHC46009.1 hypothetical protein GCM10010349_08570 [Streptomyces flavofungini]
MPDADGSTFPVQSDVLVRQADLGRDGSADAIGVARWLEDARIRLRLRRFERLVASGGFVPFQIFFVNQHVERLRPVGRAGARAQVHTGVRRIGRSSFTYEQAAFIDGGRVASGNATIVLVGASGALPLPDELVEDLGELALPESSAAPSARPGPERGQRDHYRYFAPLLARIGDVDSNQHVNYIALATYYDEAIAAFVRHAAGTAETDPVPDLPPQSYRVHYLGEVTYPGRYEIGVVVRSVDADSVSYELGVFRDSECLGVAEAVGPRGDLTAESLKAWTG